MTDKLQRAVIRDQVRLVCLKLVADFLETYCADVALRVGEAVGAETMYWQIVGQAKGGQRIFPVGGNG